MTKSEAENIIVAFETLSKDDREAVLKTYFNSLLHNMHGTGRERYEKCSFAVSLLRTCIQYPLQPPQ